MALRRRSGSTSATSTAPCWRGWRWCRCRASSTAGAASGGCWGCCWSCCCSATAPTPSSATPTASSRWCWRCSPCSCRRRCWRRGGGVPAAGPLAAGFAALALGVVAIGYPVQRHYLDERFRNELASESIPGMHLDSAYRWARDLEDARIGLAGTSAGLRPVRLLRHRSLQPRRLPRRRRGRTAPSTRSPPAPASAPPSTPPISTTWSPPPSSTSSTPSSRFAPPRRAGCGARPLRCRCSAVAR